MQALEPLGVMMSGSGPTVFALTETQEQAETIKEKLKATMADPDLEVWATRFVYSGVHVIED